MSCATLVVIASIVGLFFGVIVAMVYLWPNTPFDADERKE